MSELKVGVLRPKPSPYPLVRIGGQRDGAYLLPNDFSGVKACFSPGVSNSKDFEDELTEKYGIECHLCDYSTDPNKFRTPLKTGQTLKQKWLDITGDRRSISLAAWVTELAPDPAEDLILQMDIEGAEYRNLIHAPTDVLRRFRIVVIELHGLAAWDNSPGFRKDLDCLLTVLDRYFICVHAHPNNCCGSFALTEPKIDLPACIELTLLRRDRWPDRVGHPARFYQPLIPHPLDVTNVPENPPLFLGEAWLESGQRADVSIIKMLQDQMNYLFFKLNSQEQAEKTTILQLHRLAQRIERLIPGVPETVRAEESAPRDLALGKRFVLSSAYGSHAREGVVGSKSPFFFHTGQGHNQTITIDLKTPCRLVRLIVSNRTDNERERARCLFYSLHDESTPDLMHAFPLAIDESFLAATRPSYTDLRNRTARYVTIFSPEATCLHLASIEILGFPLLDGG